MRLSIKNDLFSRSVVNMFFSAIFQMGNKRLMDVWLAQFNSNNTLFFTVFGRCGRMFCVTAMRLVRFNSHNNVFFTVLGGCGHLSFCR